MNGPKTDLGATPGPVRKKKVAGATVRFAKTRSMIANPRHRRWNNGRLGKIRSLPPPIRDEVSRRLEEGHLPREIADWLKGREEVRQIIAEKWRGQSVDRQAVWVWRRTGYKEWKQKREHLENLKELSEYALKLGQAAGGSVADGSAAIAGGRIMSILENASDEETLKMVRAISELRAGDFTKARLQQGDKKIAQAEQKLELERKRFQRESTELFLKWYGNKKARDIVESRKDNREKLELLGREIFGEHW